MSKIQNSTARMGTMHDVARELGISVKTARKWWAQGRLPGYKLGSRCVRFDLDAVRQVILEPAKIHAFQ